MRWPGTLGFPLILTIALCCSDGGDAKRAPASGSGGSDQGAGTESIGGTMPSGGSTIRAANLGDPGNCCSARQAPGCDNAAVQDCVCDVGTYCCNTAWDTACVRSVDELGCGICPISMSEPDSGGAGGAEAMDSGGAAGSAAQPGSGEWSSCCEEQTKAGCGDAQIELKVCRVDSYCCEKRWDDYCALEAEMLGGAPCTTFNGSAGAGGQGG